MNCRKAEEMILNGETSRERKEHLVRCKKCAGLLRSMEQIQNVCLTQYPDVPEKLDRAVLAFAAEQTAAGKSQTGKPLVFSRFALRICAVAAMLVVCTVLGIVSMTGAVPEKTGALRPDAIPAVAQSVDSAVSSQSFLNNAVEMDTELLTLAVELDQTATDLFAVASVSPDAWYTQNSDYDF